TTEKAANIEQTTLKNNELSEKLNEKTSPTGMFFLPAKPTVLSGIILALLAVIMIIYIKHAKKQTKTNKNTSTLR
ncbi:MAG: hypothetical protein KAS30_02650, partial [Candidatus Diapherotrites archaeon]|nr:hypothetical protein [Candidatus Diapherotrites archaeon]